MLPAAPMRCILLVALVWGSSCAAKTATVTLSVTAVPFARYAISALACGALAASRRRRRRWNRAGVRVGALLGVTQAPVLAIFGVADTSTANAGLITSPCGGTHVRSFGDLAEVVLPTLKVTKGLIRKSCSAIHRSH